MKRLNLPGTTWMLAGICLLWAIASSAQTFTTLAALTSAESAIGPPVQGFDGNFYGLSIGSGNCNFGSFGIYCGAFYQLTPSGGLTTLFTFTCEQTGICPDGDDPTPALALGTDGNFYGTTGGTVFKITPAGVLTTIYDFCSKPNCADGFGPGAALVQGSDGNFYGTTQYGGNGDLAPGSDGFGTVFKITPAGDLTTLYRFCPKPGCYDGVRPITPLIQAANGNFYGATNWGGTHSESWCATYFYKGCGTVFEITPQGKLTTIYDFCAEANCADPSGVEGLTQASNGNFYGVDGAGGANSYGFVFELTPGGKLTNLYSFCAPVGGCLDGFSPNTPLVLGSNGSFFDTMFGGADNWGTAFEFTLPASLTELHVFQDSSDGALVKGMIQSTNGQFYGVTETSAFSISIGLKPFVETLPVAGVVGADVVILGNALTGTSSVTFNGKSASFTVLSDTEITASVPRDATTGTVKVVTPSATLDSNVEFRVAN